MTEHKLVDEVKSRTATESEALLALYRCINGPVSVGSVWVKYSRKQADAMIYTLQQIMALHGYSFEDENK